MPKKAPPLCILPLQHIVAEVVTDPAEIAAMDEMRKRLKRGKRRKPLHIAPMQVVVGEAGTDPVELAAMDDMRKRLKQKQNRAKAKAKRSVAGPAAKKKA